MIIGRDTSAAYSSLREWVQYGDELHILWDCDFQGTFIFHFCRNTRVLNSKALLSVKPPSDIITPSATRAGALPFCYQLVSQREQQCDPTLEGLQVNLHVASLEFRLPRPKTDQCGKLHMVSRLRPSTFTVFLIYLPTTGCLLPCKVLPPPSGTHFRAKTPAKSTQQLTSMKQIAKVLTCLQGECILF